MDYLDDIFYESYIGKTKYLLQAEAILNKMIATMRKDKTIDWSNHPLNKQLEKLFVKQFGFKRVYLLWYDVSMTVANGKTLLSSDILWNPNFDLKFIKDKQTGYYDKNHQRVAYIRINMKMFTNINMTGGEALAIILHEFGHNFDDSLYSRIDMLLIYIRSVRMDIFGFRALGVNYLKTFSRKFAELFLATTNFGHKLLGEINNVIERIIQFFPVTRRLEYALTKAYDFKKQVIFLTNLMMMTKNDLKNEVYGITRLIKNFPQTQFNNLMTRKKEQFADSFAAAYGYGPELSRALDKLDYSLWFSDIKKVSSDNTNIVYKLCVDFFLFKSEIIQFCNSEHGTTGTRVASIKREIAKDIKTADYPPQLKKDIIESARELDKVYQDVLTCHGNEKKFVLTSFTRRALDIVFGGRSDIIARLFPDNTVRTSMQTNKERIRGYYDKFSGKD